MLQGRRCFVSEGAIIEFPAKEVVGDENVACLIVHACAFVMLVSRGVVGMLNNHEPEIDGESLVALGCLPLVFRVTV